MMYDMNRLTNRRAYGDIVREVLLEALVNGNGLDAETMLIHVTERLDPDYDLKRACEILGIPVPKRSHEIFIEVEWDREWSLITKSNKKPRKMHRNKLAKYLDSLRANGYTLDDGYNAIYAWKEEAA